MSWVQNLNIYNTDQLNLQVQVSALTLAKIVIAKQKDKLLDDESAHRPKDLFTLNLRKICT